MLAELMRALDPRLQLPPTLGHDSASRYRVSTPRPHPTRLRIMDGNDNPASRPPAVLVGGQRRRLARRSAAPRSNTMPVLSPSATAASSVSTLTNELTATQPEDASTASNETDPMTGRVNDLRPSPNAEGDAQETNPLTPTTSNSAMTTKESKEKHSFFDSFKIKDSSRDPPKQSPLPPHTPTKAAKLLGLDMSTTDTAHAEKRDDSLDERVNSTPVRSVLQKVASMPILTVHKSEVGSKFSEEGCEPDPRKPSVNLWSTGMKKAGKMLESLPSPLLGGRAGTSEASVDHQPLPPFPLGSRALEDAYYINSLIDQHELPCQPPPPPEPRSSRRRNRKKDGKILHCMTPIEEASHDNADAASCDGEDDAELKLIEHYRKHRPAPVMLPRSRTAPFLTAQSKYELAVEDVSPTAHIIKGEPEEDDYTKRVRLPVEHYKAKVLNQSAPGHVRSPLQHVEDRLLDAAEMALEARETAKTINSASQHKSKSHLEEDRKGKGVGSEMHPGMKVDLSKMKPQHTSSNQVHDPLRVGDDRFRDPIEIELEKIVKFLDEKEAERLALNASVAALKKNHEKMKSDFAALKLSQLTPIPPSYVKNHDACTNCGDHILGVDNCDKNDDKAADVEEDEDEDDLVSIRNSINLDEEPTVHVAKAMTITRVTPGMVKLVDIPPRKKRPSYVKDWVDTYNATEQRPISERYDDDVLRDREHPPAPLPK